MAGIRRVNAQLLAPAAEADVGQTALGAETPLHGVTGFELRKPVGPLGASPTYAFVSL